MVRWSMDENIEIWDISDFNNPEYLGVLQNDGANYFNRAVFSPDGKVLATDLFDRILLWDFSNPNNPQVVSQLPGDSDSSSMVFIENGTILAVANNDKTIDLFDLTDPTNPRIIGHPLDGFTGIVTSMVYISQRNILATGSLDGKIWLWEFSDPENSKPLGRPAEGIDQFVGLMVTSPDGNTLATEGNANIQLWDITDSAHVVKVGEPLKGHITGINNLVFTGDGQNLLSVGSDGLVWLWNINVNDWKSTACTIANRNLTYDEWQQYLPDKAYQFTCPDIPIASSGVGEYTDLAEAALAANDQATAELAYSTATEKLTGSNQPENFGEICQHGSLDGFANIVLPACNTAVSIAIQNNELNLTDYRYYRGIALALTGDYEGAVEDIQYFLDQPTEETGDYGVYWREKRESWMADLKSGVNPFDEQTLAEIHQDSFGK